MSQLKSVRVWSCVIRRALMLHLKGFFIFLDEHFLFSDVKCWWSHSFTLTHQHKQPHDGSDVTWPGSRTRSNHGYRLHRYMKGRVNRSPEQTEMVLRQRNGIYHHKWLFSQIKCDVWVSLSFTYSHISLVCGKLWDSLISFAQIGVKNTVTVWKEWEIK